MSRSVAVIDIGKTNKKIAIYDERLRQVAARQAEFAAEPITSGEGAGLDREPIEAMWDWFKSELARLYRRHPFHAISITTHGATIACLDGDGDLALPVVAYDNALSAATQRELDEDFYRQVGPLERVQAETGTCDMPLLINPAKALLFYKQHFPAGMARCQRILNFPNYWGFRLTGRMASEPTYTFNHSFLHDIRTRRPSSVAERLGVDRMLDRRFQPPWAELGRLNPTLQWELGIPSLPVTVGIHDSNAALLPYLVVHQGRDFVLNSTGTWCVAMHAVDDVHYRDEELGRKIIFNVDALGGYQKTSFLMGGQDYDLYHGLIGGEHPPFDAARLDASLADAANAIVPGAFPSQFPKVHGGAKDADTWYTVADLEDGKRPDWFADQARAHDLLNASLALQTEVALARTDITPGTTIFIEGGFRRNPAYLALLAALYPDSEVACTSLEQATATGTALLGQALLAGSSPTAFAEHLHIEERPVARPDLGNLAAYREAFCAAMT